MGEDWLVTTIRYPSGVQRIIRTDNWAEWGRRTVGDVASQCTPENTIEPQADALKALSIMKQTGASRLMVVEGGHLASSKDGLWDNNLCSISCRPWGEIE